MVCLIGTIIAKCSVREYQNDYLRKTSLLIADFSGYTLLCIAKVHIDVAHSAFSQDMVARIEGLCLSEVKVFCSNMAGTQAPQST